jgi:hypothetical protein
MSENTETLLRPAMGHRPADLTEAAARAKMTGYIDACRAKAAATLTSIRDIVPTDHVVPASGLGFVADAGKIEYLAAGIGRESLHRNALAQLASRLEIPMAYIDHLVGAQERTDLEKKGDGGVVNRWGLNLLAQSLREHVVHSDDRYLIRSVNGEARAVLSDKFRRIDCRPSALALLEAAQTRGLVVADGSFTDTRSTLKFIKPEVMEVFPGEFMVFGFDWSNSDYGRGASDLRLFFFRCWCWNGATGESVVRQIHIGKRLQEGVDYARETIEADARASALALRDAAAHALSPAKVDLMIETIRAANATKIDPKNRVETLRKTLTKGETEKVVEAFNSPDVENMPAGNTLWRWSNAISWVGGHDVEDPDRRIDFERLAGDVLKPAAVRAA